MDRSKLLALAGCLTLMACSTGAEREAGAIDGRVEAARQAEAACLAGVQGQPAVRRAMALLVAGEDDPAKLEKMSDGRTMDPATREDLLDAHRRLLPCRAAAEEAYAAAHPSYGEVAAATHAAQDRVLLALLNGQATVGEANQALAELDGLSRQAWSEATAMVGQRLAGAHEAELDRRQAGALALQQWSLQQRRARPPAGPPTTTTCRNVAGTLTCNTF